MIDEDKALVLDDESNVDQINSLITNSDDTDSVLKEEQKNVEKIPTEEKQETVKASKAKESQAVKAAKTEIEHKKPYPVKESQLTNFTPEKKQETKKEAKPEKQDIVEKKYDAIKHDAKKDEKLEKTVKPEKMEKKHEKTIVYEIKKEVKDVKPVVAKNKKDVHIKHDVKQEIIEKKEDKHKPVSKAEPKKIVRVAPIVKNAAKVIITKKSVKEEKMKNHKEHQKKSSSNKNMFMWIGIGVLAIILVVALIVIFTPKKMAPVPTNLTSNSIAATVNGDPIYLQDVKKEYDALDPTIKSVYTVESILNKSIDDLLLYQYAKNNDIQVSATEVQTELDNIKIQNQLTDTALQAALTQQGLTLDSVKTLIEKNLMIRKLLNATVLKNITVTDSQIESYYNQNLDQFKVPAQVTVQHILILVTPNVTNATAYAKIEQINKELNSTNFCELVTKYTEDPGSINTCGTYTFGRGQMVPEFENPSFDMKVGETTIVQSSYGYHLIKKLADIPARTLNFSEVTENISMMLHDQIAQKDFDALLTDLRANATIINYLTKTSSNETSDPPITEVKNLDDFAKCITTNGAVFYGASWCTHCQNQKTMFGNSLQYVKYVECAEPGNTQTQECTDAGISGYPTWIINNQSYPGEQTLESLAKLTGCILPQ